jgi:polyisoprenoid-binding protein YceI
MSVRYRLDPGHSLFTVQAFAGGVLSFLGHSPTFAVRDFQGEIRWGPTDSNDAGVEVIVGANSLELTDKVRPADREEIQGRMRREVLETAVYPEIRYGADEIAAEAVTEDHYRVRIAGSLTLHGVSNRQTVDGEMLVYDDGVRLGGEFSLRLSDFRIRPVTALGGSIRLRDDLRLSFDIVAWKEAS